MSYDIRGEIASGAQRLGYQGLSMIGSVSSGILEEQQQMREQQGHVKKTLWTDYIGELGYAIAVATKRVYDEIKAQHVFLLNPNGETVAYLALSESGHGVLKDRGHKSRVASPKEAIDRMLMEAYGLFRKATSTHSQKSA